MLFYPIDPGCEDESWQRFFEEALPRFFAGTYAGEYMDASSRGSEAAAGAAAVERRLRAAFRSQPAARPAGRSSSCLHERIGFDRLKSLVLAMRVTENDACD